MHRLSLLLLACACAPSGASDRDGAADSDRAGDSDRRADSDTEASGPRARTFVVLGSSTAAAFGLLDASKGWVARWEEVLKRDHHPDDVVVNLAVPGFRTSSILPGASEGHDLTEALAQAPDAIVVNLPSNDAASGMAVETSLQNLETLREAAGGVPIWMTTSQPRKLGAGGQAKLAGYRDGVLEAWGARALDFWTPLATADGQPDPAAIQFDGIHPNAEGHARLFAVIEAADLPAALDATP
ncbi:MAG: SGNH/GDSL hydrolase family protein [Alphaproteobacteria bacterium]|nr:SGNH/GDSL hydrolase family protein [Alphaproteobacteria bacterium]